VAAVALAHGVNANLVRKWLMGRGFKAGGLVVAGDARAALGPKKALAGAVRSEAMRFVPVGVAEAVSAAQTAPMEIELRRGDASLMVRWPTGRAQDCPAWLGAVAEAVLKR
jgi:transposase-like protein